MADRQAPPDEAGNQHTVLLDTHWREVFNRYDADGNGELTYRELYKAIRTDKESSVPEAAVLQLWRKADTDESGHLDYDEFLKMVTDPANHSVFGHLSMLLNSYVGMARPHRKGVTADTPADEWDKGEYEDQYSCWPPAVGMLLVSLVEIGLFVYDWAAYGETLARGPVASALIFDPYRRYEAWRYVTYMFVHVGFVHIISNLVIQIMLGIPLEMVHHSWRVGLVYVAGVLAGSLGTSIISPRVYLAGASGGVYALITAHLATIIMNWKEMKYAVYQLLVFLVWCAADVGTAIYNHVILQLDDKIGYMAHLCGALAGLLVSVLVLRNLTVLRWERVVWWTSLVTYVALMMAAIVWSAAADSYFPKPR